MIKLPKHEMDFDFTRKEVSNDEKEKKLIVKKMFKNLNLTKFFFGIGCVLVVGTLIAYLGSLGWKSYLKNRPSVNALDKVNKVVLYETILFDNNNLYKLQNNIYKNLNAQSQNINFIITNPELLVFDLNIKEFQGVNLAIGNDSKIEISINKDKKIISYSNFTEIGKEEILKQMDNNNYPKIKIKTENTKNKDDTYNINFIIDKEL